MTTTKIGYTILSHSNCDNLSGTVRRYLSEGWQLYGFPYWNGKFHCQALIKADAKSSDSIDDYVVPYG